MQSQYKWVFSHMHCKCIRISLLSWAPSSRQLHLLLASGTIGIAGAPQESPVMVAMAPPPSHGCSGRDNGIASGKLT